MEKRLSPPLVLPLALRFLWLVHPDRGTRSLIHFSRSVSSSHVIWNIFVLSCFSPQTIRIVFVCWFFIIIFFCPGIKVLIIYSSNCSRVKEYRVVGSGGK